MFVESRYASVFESPTKRGTRSPWPRGDLYDWDETSTYIQEPPFLVTSRRPAPSSRSAAPACWPAGRFGHHRPHLAGRQSIAKDSPAGKFLMERGVEPARLQQLRQPPRQRPRDGPRHVRQHPHPQPCFTRRGPKGAYGPVKSFSAHVRIDTPVELDYYKNGGILQTVVRKLLAG
jgi:aconitase A